MKIACWNVNSVRARLPHLLDWLAAATPDVLLLQETKSRDENFPGQEISDSGYHFVHYGQPAYNGVAILSRTPLTDVVSGNPHRPGDKAARLIAATTAGLRVLSVYVPNGQTVDSEKYDYKLSWLADFAAYLETLAGDATIAAGDYNIAPADEDIYDAQDWGEGILASPPERQALAQLLARGYTDAQSLCAASDNRFTWWDYRAAAFRRNRGLRIDLMLVSATVTDRVSALAPDIAPRGWERPSDHTPLVLTLH